MTSSITIRYLLIWLMSENIGRYIEMTMPPTMVPGDDHHRLQRRHQIADSRVDFLFVKSAIFVSISRVHRPVRKRQSPKPPVGKHRKLFKAQQSSGPLQ
jgi:hypothetical protein